MSDTPDANALVARIDALEHAVEGLQRELAMLRSTSARAPFASTRREPTAAPAHGPAVPLVATVAPAAPVPGTEPRLVPAGLDLETLVGRYGMLALATLLALAAVGTFVRWAVAHGLLGPSTRVLLGLIAAAALAVWGVRLRRKERSFGDSILGLSLAITHVCAWAAGPSLHLVPPFAALALSAAFSVGLAGLALVEGDEPLWCVGFGGAAVAPFVTSTGQGTASMLAAYGAAVLIAGGSALASRPWKVAARVFGAAAALFTLALMSMPRAQQSAELALALPVLVAALGVLPIARGEMVRPRLRTLGVLAAVAALHLSGPSSSAAFATAATALLWLLLLERVDVEPAGLLLDGIGDAGTALADWADGAVIPVALVLAAANSLESWPLQPHHPPVAVCGLAATAFALSASRRAQGTLRDALAFSSFGFANAAVLAGVESTGQLPLALAALSGVAVLFTLLERPVPNRSWRWAPQLMLTATAVAVLGLLQARLAYAYVPFFTGESFAAFAVLAAWAITGRLARNEGVRAAPWIFGFLWVHEELVWAVDPSISTLLIVTWYAVSSVACVGVGRARAEPRLRHVGLGLGIVAALLALRAAWGLQSAGTRIGGYLVVSAFLLGIAWWYRRPGADPAPDAA